MEHGKVGCRLIVSAARGHERAVLRDLLDLLFPYDNSVDYSTVNNRICIKTTLDLNAVSRILGRFPVRNLVSARYVLLSEEAKPNLEEGLKRLCSRMCGSNIRFRKVSVRLRSREGWRQEYYYLIRECLQECTGGSADAYIEFFNGILVLTLKVF
ncbi:hypothetical protein IG193_06375 [Infirmifilum lucidum]|uniref:Uncharacterized protein n=1 Tax=Infirmifilum lucidum TaxID=2776706 RepID=A0A7L9FF74_9CREN|nr:hypothetical protein [Infirmifilum lucidum]QOJ78379.1 hypothetical protein IG193_06375 [Infirmifilum lucidum]